MHKIALRMNYNLYLSHTVRNDNKPVIQVIQIAKGNHTE
jgi:hypothetical protein